MFLEDIFVGNAGTAMRFLINHILNRGGVCNFKLIRKDETKDR